ncbi:4-hydroxy-2-oxovalerate aldolase [Campylobacter californiensis]|uniref:4-hydroxy-2-oxovalerate aldolase n=1 Tax=Campylobacter californiensis TaxID=1032243 RepID=UPI00147430A8|nr:4-hydroxy-2-oxovalerate aldolase [Campylobacter sp. RM12916]MBE3609023.1 4-hydroxy-2-oxovalerate aldolase [Campylobacter sp. RM12916]
MKNIILYDVSLRDGSHAIAHQLTADQISTYARGAEESNLYAIEVGHGNGLGASSLLVGESKITDEVMLKTAKEQLVNTKLGIHLISGFATINKDLKNAIDYGVDIVRVASHSTEADVTQRHIGYVRERDKQAYGLLMNANMTTPEILLQEAYKMQTYGAQAIVILDSSGSFLPSDVEKRIKLLVENLSVPIGFHAHNNLGLSVYNSIAALEAGASIIDASINGFGAGAGNTPLEVLVGVLTKYDGYNTGVDLYKILDLADIARLRIVKSPVVITPLSIVGGLASVFSAFSGKIKTISSKYGVDPRDVFFELGKEKVIGGQEDKIVEVVIRLHKCLEENKI